MDILRLKSNALQLSKRYKKAADKYKKTAKKSNRDAGMFMKNTAKQLAPQKTGETRRGIRLKTTGNKAVVSSTVTAKGQTGFMQNYWTNQSAPFRSVKMYWNNFDNTVYGDGTHRTTGTPRWFHIASLRARKYFKDTSEKKAEGVLKSEGLI